MSVFHKDPETMGGEPVFKGSRVLMQNLFDLLVSDDALREFLEDFPGISKETAIAAVDEAREALAEKLAAEQLLIKAQR